VGERRRRSSEHGMQLSRQEEPKESAKRNSATI
jgi:hypothetical protein